MSSSRAELFLKQGWGGPIQRTEPNPESHKVAVVMIEPRAHPLIAPVMRNVVEGLERDPRIATTPVLFTSAQAMDFVHAEFDRDEKITTMVLNLPDPNLTVHGYNRLLRSVAFWDMIPHEWVLIIQTDGFLQNAGRSLADFIELDVSMIGGLYNYVAMDVNGRRGRVCTDYADLTQQLHASPSLQCGINGGVSLRRKSDMLECLRRVSVNDIIEHRVRCGMNAFAFTDSIGEDVYFQNALDVLRKPLPRVYDCMRFANNMYYPEFLDVDEAPPMFVHGFQKPWFSHASGTHAASWEETPRASTSDFSPCNV